MTNWQSLIDALEQAEGPSFELDCQIHAAVLGGAFDGSEWAQVAFIVNGERHVVSPRSIPNRTASIDAALSWMPDGWEISIVIEVDGRGSARVWERLGDDPPSRAIIYEATNPALAICIAIARARQELATMDIGNGG